MSGPLVEMVVESVRVHMLSSNHVVILKSSDGERYLPIWIGQWEASAIAMRLQGVSPDRPLTHDLLATTLTELGAEVRRIVISELADDTFHARIAVAIGDRIVDVDARPSDALALALRAGAPIYAEPEVLEAAGITPGADDGSADDLAGSLLDRRPAGDRTVDPRLDVFRDFINSLGADPEGGSREGPQRG
ncbi:MAG: bifunctional nuclease family protein [Candidatus Limnocylindrales bacterium]